MLAGAGERFGTAGANRMLPIEEIQSSTSIYIRVFIPFHGLLTHKVYKELFSTVRVGDSAVGYSTSAVWAK